MEKGTGKNVLYHGSNIPPSKILKEGIIDPYHSREWFGIFLTKDKKYAQTYGCYVYEIDFDKIPNFNRYLQYLGSSPYKGEEWHYTQPIEPEAVSVVIECGGGKKGR